MAVSSATPWGTGGLNWGIATIGTQSAQMRQGTRDNLLPAVQHMMRRLLDIMESEQWH